MKFFTITFFLVFCTIISVIPANSQENKWTIAKNKDGITVLTRQLPNSNRLEYMATITVKANIKDIIKIMDDVPDYTKWIANLNSAKTLKKVNNNERYDYYVTYLPWPFENRDIIFHYTSTRNIDGKLIIDLTSVPDFIPQKNGIIRIKKASGYWKLIPSGQGKIIIIYQLNADPEGNFPNWILNMFIVNGPYKTLNNLRNLLMQ